MTTNRSSSGLLGLTLFLLAGFTGACRSTDPFALGDSLPAPKAGAVVAEHPLAVRVGLATLDRGGNAADAAVSTALALAVVYPQ
ncbi:MAG: gamma-glutamyltransferase, partial [Planctomycetota bacterium]